MWTVDRTVPHGLFHYAPVSAAVHFKVDVVDTWLASAKYRRHSMLHVNWVQVLLT